eukprot:Hpha_TRINITY_DN24714_c0_g1::TRINITY_DN24714_c0_g1_i1::g.110258::m.110258
MARRLSVWRRRLTLGTCFLVLVVGGLQLSQQGLQISAPLPEAPPPRQPPDKGSYPPSEAPRVDHHFDTSSPVPQPDTPPPSLPTAPSVAPRRDFREDGQESTELIRKSPTAPPEER